MMGSHYQIEDMKGGRGERGKQRYGRCNPPTRRLGSVVYASSLVSKELIFGIYLEEIIYWR